MLRRGPRDGGFTLVELLISVVIMGIVFSSVTGVLLVTLRTADDADTRLTESNDLLRVTRYFTGDVLGATSVTVASTPKCGTDPTAVVEFVGQDIADGAVPAPTPAVTPTVVTTVVAYVLRTRTDLSGTYLELHRLTCSAPTAAPAYPLVPLTAFAVVRHLSNLTPTASCLPACATFTQVDLVVREKSAGLVYTLTGRRRTG